MDESETVQRILLMGSHYARLKYLSYSYRFNGKVLPIIKNLVVRPDSAFDGYTPTQGALDVSSDPGLAVTGRETGEFPDWDLKLKYLKELAQYCRKNGTRLFLI